MAIWDETLPDGRSVYEAVAGLRKPRISFGAGGLSGVEPVGRTPNAPVSTTPQINPNISMRPDAPPAILGPRVSPIIPSNAGLEPPANAVNIPNPRIDPSKVDFTPYPQDASKSGRLAIDLGAMRGAGPRSPITTTDEGVSVGAPKPKGHGFLNTLKNVGRGAIIGMGDIAAERAAHGQRADLGELLGGAAGGGIGGGISPITIDQRIADQAIQRKQGELGNQLEIEKQQALIDKAQQGPAPSQARHKIVVPDDSLKAEGINAGDEVWADVNGQPLIANGRHVLAGRAKEPVTKTPRAPIFRERKNRDGTVTTLKSDDSGNTWKEVPELTSQPAPEKPDTVGMRQGEERQRKYDAANRELESLKQAEANAAANKDKAVAEYNDAKARYGQTNADERAAFKPELDAAKQKAEDAQKFYASFGPKKTKAQKDADENAPPKFSAIEQKIYDAAKGKNLDPDEAVRRYRAGKY